MTPRPKPLPMAITLVILAVMILSGPIGWLLGILGVVLGFFWWMIWS